MVLSKDEPELAATLASLRPQVEALGAECLVVDRSAGRLDEVRLTHPWVRWIDYCPPPGVAFTIAQQRNVGIRQARGEVVAFCDVGGAPDGGWLEALCEPLLVGRARATTGPITSRRASTYQVLNDLPDHSTTETVITSNFAATRSCLEAIGGFDERFAYGSDVDLGLRLADRGIEVLVVRAAAMALDWGGGSRQLRRDWRYGRARGRLLRYHPKRRAELLRRAPETVAYPLLVLGLPLGIAIAARTEWWWLLAAWPAAVGVLWFRNRRLDRPWSALFGHVLYGFGALVDLFGAVSPVRPTLALSGPATAVADWTDALAALGIHAAAAPTGLRRFPWLWWGRCRGLRLLHELGPSRSWPLARVLGVSVFAAPITPPAAAGPIAPPAAGWIMLTEATALPAEVADSIHRALATLEVQATDHATPEAGGWLAVLGRLDLRTVELARRCAAGGASVVVVGPLGLVEPRWPGLTQVAPASDLAVALAEAGADADRSVAGAQAFAAASTTLESALSWRARYLAALGGT